MEDQRRDEARLQARYGDALPADGTEVLMLVTTTWNVFGLVVRSRSIVMNIGAGLRSLFGGEIKIYTELLEQSRNTAIQRMIQHAEALGGNAVLSMRFDASQISN